MKIITTRVEKYVESITSIITLVNVAVPRITVGTDYALLRDEESQLTESRRAPLKRPNEPLVQVVYVQVRHQSR